MNEPPEKPSKIKEFLKQKNDNIDLSKLEETKTPRDYNEFIRRKLTDDPKKPMKFNFNFDFKARYVNFIKFKNFQQKRILKFTKETLPIMLFISFSCYIIWKMEDQLDGMRRKVIRSKSIKQLEVERENEVKSNQYIYQLITFKSFWREH